mmetsp:Transcript_96201/g.170802  ORF Transcript_96201/g.170802 Transcript_96201/m.170802 type:complete len:390 (+) Transcript_96201:46-1215(+)
MKSFDAFARPVQEFQVKTAVGGYISIASICLVITLFLSELRYFLTLEDKDQMIIDQNQDQKYLNVTMDMTFSAVPCAVLSMNLMDPKKANVMHVSHEIYKTRISQTGRVLGRRIRDSLTNVAANPSELSEASGQETVVKSSHATTHMRCASCFQSHTDEDDCCNTCEDVRKEFRQRGFNDKPEAVFAQCIKEAYEQAPAETGEGCRLQARLLVRKVPAILHLGVARTFKSELAKLKEEEEGAATMDFSHKIDDLSFGPAFPGLVHVLNGRQKSTHEHPTSEHYQYDVHVIPTRYQEDGADEVPSHQYSVTEYVKAIDARFVGHDVAATGLWMTYDFTPFEVRVNRTRKSLWHFLTECCAILGGIFAFSGMLDNFAHQMSKTERGTALGK